MNSAAINRSNPWLRSPRSSRSRGSPSGSSWAGAGRCSWSCFPRCRSSSPWPSGSPIRPSIERFTRTSFNAITVTILMPLVAILFGAGAFGAEIDEGTVVYLLAKPVRRVWIVLAKALSAMIMAVLLTGISTGCRRRSSSLGSDGRWHSRRRSPGARRGRGLGLLRVAVHGRQPVHAACARHRHRLHADLGRRALGSAVRASPTTRSASTRSAPAA